MKIVLLSILTTVMTLNAWGQTPNRIEIHADQEKYTMAGGFGASWHSIAEDTIDESAEYTWALRFINSRGSAWGGNPPVTDTRAWKQIYRYASWLGFSWLRVELSARMYEPNKDQFDWDDEEMQALYKILDWAENHDADVFLQQMWSNVKWNAYPGVQPLLSAPRSLEDFAEGLSRLIDHLVNEKKYTCIRWLCITNEPPGGGWGSWWSTGEKDAPLTPALKEVRKALDEKNLKLPLSGPDWTDLPPFQASKIDFDPYIGAYDIHSYQGIGNARQKELKKWADWAGEQDKPLFLSEFGDMRVGWKDSNPGPKSFQAALSNAESILRGLEAGVSGFNRWSFTNRGDLDGQWQLIRTWDRENKRYYTKIEIEPAAFYGYGIITRFARKHSTVVVTELAGNADILSQTLKSPEGILTTYILNKGLTDQTITIRFSGGVSKQFFLYRAKEEEVVNTGFRMNPVQEIRVKDGEEFVLQVPGLSISTLSQYFLLHKNLPVPK